MKTTFALLLLLLMSTITRAEWTPPENPDPQKILQEAQDNAEAQRYEDALAKHLWFHEHALQHRRSLYGVRLSFALNYWHELGRDYPPALEKLKAVRDAAGQAVREGKPQTDPFFHDFSAINRVLGEQEKTAELFRWLDNNKPEVAKRVADLARPALIRSKNYTLAGKHLDSTREYERIVQRYSELGKMAEQPRFGDNLRQHAEKNFTNRATTLIALLVQNGRKAEAEEIAKKAAAEKNTAEFAQELKDALSGTVPEPWP